MEMMGPDAVKACLLGHCQGKQFARECRCDGIGKWL